MLAIAIVFWSAVSAAMWQSPAKPSSTGIPECDKYDAMVTACLPKMCEEERMLKEMELGFHRQLMPATIQHKGRNGAAEVCARQIADAIKDDPYGCYVSSGAASTPRTIRLDKLSARDTSVSLTLTNSGTAAGEEVRLIIVTAIDAPPTAVYLVPPAKGTFVIDTASAAPTAPGSSAPGPPVRLEPQTTYCFAIERSTPTAKDYYRKGTFTTLPKR